MLLHRITSLLYIGKNATMIFGSKGGEQALAESMKEKFKLVKKLHGYAISSICDPTMMVAMQILAGKVMWKCCIDEVLTPVVMLAQQCVEGVQFSWSNYLHGEFLASCREAQEKSNTFHYMWIFLLIVLVTWELPDESQLPSVVPNLPKVAKYASLWATKDAECIQDIKIFRMLMEMNIRMGINCNP